MDGQSQVYGVGGRVPEPDVTWPPRVETRPDKSQIETRG